VAAVPSPQRAAARARRRGARAQMHHCSSRMLPLLLVAALLAAASGAATPMQEWQGQVIYELLVDRWARRRHGTRLAWAHCGPRRCHQLGAWRGHPGLAAGRPAPAASPRTGHELHLPRRPDAPACPRGPLLGRGRAGLTTAARAAGGPAQTCASGAAVSSLGAAAAGARAEGASGPRPAAAQRAGAQPRARRGAWAAEQAPLAQKRAVAGAQNRASRHKGAQPARAAPPRPAPPGGLRNHCRRPSPAPANPHQAPSRPLRGACPTFGSWAPTRFG
jgi:hypothetical protein